MIDTGREGSTGRATFRGRAMRWKMTVQRRMILVAVAAADLALIVQRASGPRSSLAFFRTMAVVIPSPAMLVLFGLASGD